MKGLNKVLLIGFTGKDAECRYTPTDNLCIARVSLATSNSIKDKQTGEVKSKTEWHTLKVFGKLAEIIRDHVPKGTQIYVEGSLRTEKWQDKNKNDKEAVVIIVDELIILSPKEKKEAVKKDESLFTEDDEIPF